MKNKDQNILEQLTEQVLKRKQSDIYNRDADKEEDDPYWDDDLYTPGQDERKRVAIEVYLRRTPKFGDEKPELADKIMKAFPDTGEYNNTLNNGSSVLELTAFTDGKDDYDMDRLINAVAEIVGDRKFTVYQWDARGENENYPHAPGDIR